MNKRNVVYTEAPESISREIAEGEVIADFLPPPEDLLRKEQYKKVEGMSDRRLFPFSPNRQNSG
jgi:hypothetical protein